MTLREIRKRALGLASGAFLVTAVFLLLLNNFYVLSPLTPGGYVFQLISFIEETQFTMPYLSMWHALVLVPLFVFFVAYILFMLDNHIYDAEKNTRNGLAMGSILILVSVTFTHLYFPMIPAFFVWIVGIVLLCFVVLGGPFFGVACGVSFMSGMQVTQTIIFSPFKLEGVVQLPGFIVTATIIVGMCASVIPLCRALFVEHLFSPSFWRQVVRLRVTTVDEKYT